MKELRKVGLAKCRNADTYEWWKSLRTQTCWDAEMAQLLEQPVGLRPQSARFGVGGQSKGVMVGGKGDAPVIQCLQYVVC